MDNGTGFVDNFMRLIWTMDKYMIELVEYC